MLREGGVRCSQDDAEKTVSCCANPVAELDCTAEAADADVMADEEVDAALM
jgi:hypothetical protein